MHLAFLGRLPVRLSRLKKLNVRDRKWVEERVAALRDIAELHFDHDDVGQDHRDMDGVDTGMESGRERWDVVRAEARRIKLERLGVNVA